MRLLKAVGLRIFIFGLFKNTIERRVYRQEGVFNVIQLMHEGLLAARAVGGG